MLLSLGQTFIILVFQFMVFRLADNQEIFKQEIHYFPSPQWLQLLSYVRNGIIQPTERKKINSILLSINKESCQVILITGQMDSQDARWNLKIVSSCNSVWPGLVCTCVDLWWLVDQICAQMNASFSPFGTQPKSAQVEWRPFVVMAT